MWNRVCELATLGLGTVLGSERKVAPSRLDTAPLSEVLGLMQRLKASRNLAEQAAVAYLGVRSARLQQRNGLATGIAKSRAQLDVQVRDRIAKPEELTRHELAIAKAQDEHDRLGLFTRTDVSTLVPHQALGVSCMDLGVYCAPEYAIGVLHAFAQFFAGLPDMAPYLARANEVRRLLQEQKVEAARTLIESTWDQVLADAGAR